jgi:hypothetical protein
LKGLLGVLNKTSKTGNYIQLTTIDFLDIERCSSGIVVCLSYDIVRVQPINEFFLTHSADLGTFISSKKNDDSLKIDYKID